MSNVMLVILVVSTLLPVTIANRYVDWKGDCRINGGTTPLMRKSPLLIDPSTIPNSRLSTSIFESMINVASTTTVPIGVQSLTLDSYCVALKYAIDCEAAKEEKHISFKCISYICMYQKQAQDLKFIREKTIIMMSSVAHPQKPDVGMCLVNF